MHILLIDSSTNEASAVRHYAEALSSHHTVTLVAPDVITSTVVRGVHLQPGDSFPHDVPVEVVVYCTPSNELIQKYKSKIKSALSVLWISDMNYSANDYLYEIDVFAFVSEWQQQRYIDLYHIPVQKTTVFLHGISSIYQVPLDTTQKKPIFVCNSTQSYPYSILASAWSSIADAYPTAELHLYTTNIECKEMNHVKLFEPIEDYTKVYRDAMFYIYLSDSCESHIPSLMDACAGGCIPLLNNIGILDTFFNNSLPSDNTLSDQLVKKMQEYMELYISTPAELYTRSERLIQFMLSKRNYGVLAYQFDSTVTNKLKQKKQKINLLLFCYFKFIFLLLYQFDNLLFTILI